MSVLGKGSMTKFTFAQSPEGFDNHIENSVRGYTNLWHDILAMSKYFAEDNTYVVDLGCSSGKLLKNMIDYNNDHIPNAKYVGIEIEEDFAVGHGDDLISGLNAGSIVLKTYSFLTSASISFLISDCINTKKMFFKSA